MAIAFMGLTSSRDVTVSRTLSTRTEPRPTIFPTNDRVPRDVARGPKNMQLLVPSRYALRVGDIDVLVISDGLLPITAKTMATNADATEYGRWLDDNFLPRDVLDWPLNVVVVRSGDRTILVDAGLGLEFPDFPGPGRPYSDWRPPASILHP